MAALLVLAIGAWFAWGRLGSNERELKRDQRTPIVAAGGNADASKGVGSKPAIVQGDTGDWEQDPIVDWRPVIASAAATEEVFRRVSVGTRQLLSRTLASTTELGLDVPLARIEKAGEKMRERGIKLRQSMNGMSEAFKRFNAVDGKPD